ncbi:MAG: DUF362 domain-containing protein [Planctomycetota bacterium]
MTTRAGVRTSKAPADVLRSGTIALERVGTEYPSTTPYHPSEAYPEMAAHPVGTEPNAVYRGVRALFQRLGLDAENEGTPEWNPLGDWIRPGDRVVIKPNWVRDFHDELEGMIDCLVTHGSVIRAVVDYAHKALQGEGRLIVADAPQNDAVFENIEGFCGMPELQRYYRDEVGFDLEYHDLRKEYVEKLDGVLYRRETLTGDPEGYRASRLDEASELAELDEDLAKRLRGAEYDLGETYRHHHPGRHEYLICGTILAADVVINLPKLKTHKKAGLTACLKNTVGLNGDKNWLPHHREGVPSQGGDQYADSSLRRRFERFVIARFKEIYPYLPLGRRFAAKLFRRGGEKLFGATNHGTVRSGNWHGNDTLWRTILDLNKVLLYCDRDGKLHPEPQRRVLSIVDAVLGGEGNGPLAPERTRTGVLLAGVNPLAVDYASARLMGFDPSRIPQIARGFEIGPCPLLTIGESDLRCLSNVPEWNGPAASLSVPELAFEPHFGWKGHVEIDPERR